MIQKFRYGIFIKDFIDLFERVREREGARGREGEEGETDSPLGGEPDSGFGAIPGP